MLSKLSIKNLKVECVIGFNLEEQVKKRTVMINVTMWLDVEKAVKSDDIKDTINYSSVSNNVREFAEESKFNLIESLASGIADICMNEKLCRKVKVRVDKLDVPRITESACVEIVKMR
jgi:FolB domain-containing protein